MTCQPQDTEALSAVELIAARGMEGLPDVLAALINEAIRLERERNMDPAWRCSAADPLPAAGHRHTNQWQWSKRPAAAYLPIPLSVGVL